MANYSLPIEQRLVMLSTHLFSSVDNTVVGPGVGGNVSHTRNVDTLGVSVVPGTGGVV